jgi:multidrug efflux pump subunit AcrB
MEFSTKDVPIIIYALSGDFSNRQFRDFSDRMQARLSLIGSVAEVIVEGVEKDEIQVMFSSELLTRYKLSIQQIMVALRAANIDIPGGSLKLDNSRFLVSAHNIFKTAADVGNCVVSYNGISPVRLKDVSEIRRKPAKSSYAVRYNKERAVVLQVRMKGGGDVFKVTAACTRMVDKLKHEFPPSLQIAVVTNQRDSVANVVGTFESSLFLGSLLVGAIILFHMGFRTSVVVLSAIPLSLFLAIAVMAFAGIEFHKISIFSLVLVLGMMVDAGIVMAENIFRQIDDKDSSSLTSRIANAASQVAVPLFSSTLTTIAAFVPLLFMGGMTGKYISALPLTVIIALFSSLATAVFFTPLLSYWVIDRFGTGVSDVKIPFVSDEFVQNVHDWYVEKLLVLLNWRISVLIISSLFFVVAIWMIPFLGIEFFPDTDGGQFLIDAVLPAKNDLKAASDMAAQIEDILATHDGVKNYLTYIGKGVPRFHYNIYRRDAAAYASFLVTADSPSIMRKVVEGLRKKTSDISGCKITFQEVKEGPNAGFPISCRVLGSDYNKVMDIAIKLEEYLQTITGAVDVERDSFQETPAINIVLDKVKAALLGIDGAEVSRLVRLATEGYEVTTLKEEGGDELPILLRLHEDGALTPDDLLKLKIATPSGESVPLEQFASFEITGKPSVRHRRRQSPTIKVRCSLDGVTASDVLEQLKKLAKELVPPGYIIEYGGENEYRNRSFRRLAKSLVFALVLIFIILVAQFKSIAQPLVVLTCLPLSITGAVAGLFVTGHPFGFMAFLGFVALSGIVVNDAILLFDHINQKRSEGWAGRDAIVDACVVRHRAIYLTTITTMAGLLPLALGGGNLWAPLAWVIIFGIAISTFLTLIVIPAGYALVEGL